MARHYRWPHDFWRRMGKQEFYLWLDQVARENRADQPSTDSWDHTENDPGWQRLRETRDKMRGR